MSHAIFSMVSISTRNKYAVWNFQDKQTIIVTIFSLPWLTYLTCFEHTQLRHWKKTTTSKLCQTFSDWSCRYPENKN